MNAAGNHSNKSTRKFAESADKATVSVNADIFVVIARFHQVISCIEILHKH